MDGRTKSVRIKELNHFLTCVLCGGYFVDATTIVECLHSFCKSCIVRYLEASKFCPICDVQVHKARPLLSIRPDQTLQDLVYKLVPGLFTEEIKRRREFYTRNPLVGTFETSNGTGSGSDVSSSSSTLEGEQISVELQFSPDGQVPKEGEQRIERDEFLGKRYLLCPVVFTVQLIKKFLRVKFDLSANHKIDIFHADGQLSDKHTMIDIVYMCTWNGRGPLSLFYCVYTLQQCRKRPRRQNPVLVPEPEPVPISTTHRSSLSHTPVDALPLADVKPPKLIINYHANETPGLALLPNRRHVFNIQPIKEDPDSGDAADVIPNMTYQARRRSVPVSIPLKHTISLLDDDDDDDDDDEGDENNNILMNGNNFSSATNTPEKRKQTPLLDEQRESKIAKLRKRLRKHHKNGKSFSIHSLSRSGTGDSDSPVPPDSSSESDY